MDRKAKAKGSQRASKIPGKSKGKVQWLTEIQRDGGFKLLCMRYQVGKCQTPNCGFQHFVCVPS